MENLPKALVGVHLLRWIETYSVDKVIHSLNNWRQEATSHKEVRGSQIVKSEQDTCSVLQAISNLTNPFTIEDKDALYCLSFGAPVPQDVESDILMADDIGKKAHREFVRKRLVEKKITFHSPVKKQNLKTFATQAKSSMVCGKERRSINNSREKRLWATGDTGARASS